MIDINDNVILDDAIEGLITATDGHIDIFGTGKGKIDGSVNPTTGNLTLQAQTDVAVEGAIGSTNPIHNLTITANTGNVSLASTNISGSLHITKGQTATLADLTIGGDLVIDQGANVTFTGPVSVGGGISIAQANAVTFQGAVTVGGSLTITTATDVAFNGNVSVTGNLLISTANSVAFNGTLGVGGTLTLPQAQSVIFNHNVSAVGTFIGTANSPTAIGQVSFSSTARLDGAGPVAIYSDQSIVFGAVVGHTAPPTSMTLRSDSGDVSFQSTTNVTNGINILTAQSVTFAGAVAAGSLTVADAAGDIRLQGTATLGTMNVTASGLFQAVHGFTLTVGNGTITANDVDFPGGTRSVKYTGAGASVLTIKPRDTSEDITLGSPPGVFTNNLDLSDADLAAIAPGFTDVVIGDAAAGTGTVTIGSVGSQQGQGNSQWVNPTELFGGAVSVVQDFDITNLATFFKITARTGNVSIGGKINATALERNALLTMTATLGSIVLSQPVYSSSEIHLVANGSITQAAIASVNTPALRVTSGGDADLSTANNDITTVSVKSTAGVAKFRDDNGFNLNTVDSQQGISGIGAVALTTNGLVTINKPVQGASFAMNGNGGDFTINANVNSGGAITSASTTTVHLNAVTLDSSGGGITFSGPATLIGAPTLASHGGDITFQSTLDGNKDLTLQPAGGNVAFNGDVGTTTPLGKLLITSPNDVMFHALTLRQLTISPTAGIVTFDGPVSGGLGGIQIASYDVVANDTVASTGEIHLDAAGAIAESADGSFKTPRLRITSGGDADLLSGNNDAGIVSIHSGGIAHYRDDQTSIVGTVDGQSGIAATGDIILSTAGHITTGQPITGTSLFMGGGGLVTINAAVNVTGAITSTSRTTVQLDSVTVDSTTGGMTFNGPVALTANAILASHGGAITFNSALDGAHTLTLNVADVVSSPRAHGRVVRSPLGLVGDVSFAGVVGGSVPLTQLLIPFAKDVTANAVNAVQFTQTGGTGLTLLGGPVIAGAGGVNLHNVGIEVDDVLHSAGPLTLTADGNGITIDPTADLASAGLLSLTTPAALTVAAGGRITGQNGANVVLTAATLTLPSTANTVTGSGLLVLQPFDDDSAITLGGLVDGFGLTQDEVNGLGTGFQNLLIGRGRTGGFDTGDSSNGGVAIHGITFHGSVLIRADGATSDVTIDGPLAEDGAGATLAVEAGRSITVDADVTNSVSGTISLRANRAGNGNGDLLVAQNANVTINAARGNITLEGRSVLLGSKGFTARVLSPWVKGSVIVLVDPNSRRDGSFVLANARSGIYAGKNIDAGASDPNHVPAIVSVSGTMIAGGAITLRSLSDTILTDFRLRGGTGVSVAAGANLTATGNGEIIAPKKQADLRSNTAGRGGKTSIAKSVAVSVSTAPIVKAVFYKFIPATVHKATAGNVVIDVYNISGATLNTPITIRLYSSADQTLAPDDLLVSSTTVTLKNLKAGKSQRITVTVPLFPTKYATQHPWVVAEVLPYASTVPASPQPFGNGDPNVTSGTILSVGGKKTHTVATAAPVATPIPVTPPAPVLTATKPKSIATRKAA